MACGPPDWWGDRVEFWDAASLNLLVLTCRSVLASIRGSLVSI